MTKKWAAIAAIGIVIGMGAYFLFSNRNISVTTGKALQPKASSTSVVSDKEASTTSDIKVNEPLKNPPAIAKGLYLTGWVAGSSARQDQIIALMKKNGLNSVVVDIKDYSGHVSYAMDVPEVKKSGADKELRMGDPFNMIRKFHENGIYVIGRISTFQDPILAKAHPEWAMLNTATGKPWADRKGLSWMDPAAKPVWDYDIAIAKDAFNRGFDEINFDYVRFASDGNLKSIGFPVWDKVTPKHQVIADFFRYVREQLAGKTISADLFGLTAVNSDDLGIGQVIEDAYKNFDYVSPMIYPSHFANGFIGYQNPAQYPYEVIKYSMEKALAKLDRLQASSTPEVKLAKLRPWLQVFDMGAVYDKSKVDAQIRATEQVLATSTANGGWLLWDAANTYTPLK